MNRTLKRFFSFFCGMILLMTSSAVCSAAEETSEALLPSGMTAAEFEKELQEHSGVIQIDSIFLTDSDYASAAVGVFKDGEILYSGYFGNTDMENSIPADENSVYEWGSISKTFVWVSVMQLWEQGLIDFDKDIRDYLPEGFIKHLKYDEPITIMNLMNHTGGWEESSGMIFTDSSVSLSEALQLSEPQQVYRPGEIQAYSNYGAALAGYIVERISGKDYCDYVHENILDVLGMKHTAVSANHSDNSFVYEQMKKNASYHFFLGRPERLDIKKRNVTIYPAGAVTGTLNDLMIFGEALTDESAPLFKHSETQQTMLSGTLFFGETDIPVNSHGFFWMDYSVSVFGHTGATAGYISEMMIDPESGTGLVVLVNQSDDNWFYSNAPELVFGKYKNNALPSAGKKLNINGYYIPSRSLGSGMLKFTSLMSAMNFGSLFEVTDTGDGLLILKTDDDSSQIAGKIISDDGSTVIRSLSTDYIPLKGYTLKILLLSLYILLGVISVVMIMIIFKLKKFGKNQFIEGCRLVNAGYPAIIISVVLFFALFAVFSENLGIPETAVVVLGILQILCVAVCSAAAVKAVLSLAARKKGKPKLLAAEYIMSAAANIITVSAILYFELYRFM